MGEVMTSATLIRTSSFIGISPVGNGDFNAGAALHSLRRNGSGVFSPPRSGAAMGIHFQPKQSKHLLRRSRSETDIAGSYQNAVVGLLSPIPSKVVEEEDQEEKATDLGMAGFDLSLGMWPSGGTVVVGDEVEYYSGGGMGKERKTGGGRSGGDGGEGCGQENDKKRTSEYYEQMLKSDPSNPLILRNYGRFLHEVVGDTKGAEEYYSRAILASPGDGEVLSLYGKLLWEVRRDVERAETYFERAVEASPDDCYVLGSYAQFLWDAEDEEEEEGVKVLPAAAAALVEAVIWCAQPSG